MLDADAIQAIPATRTVGSLLNATPGMTVDNNGLAATPTMTFFSARGGATNEGRMTVNGMTVAAAFNGGGVSSYILDSVNVDEVSVTVSGGLGETDTGGPVMNLVPARGRQFVPRAGVPATTPATGREATTSTTSCAPANITEPPGIISAYDASVSYGGPIMRDRLWFFGSYRKLDTSTAARRHRRERECVQPGDAGTGRRTTASPARQLQGRAMYIGRATAQATAEAPHSRSATSTRCAARARR